jgi:hypothetical protein
VVSKASQQRGVSTYNNKHDDRRGVWGVVGGFACSLFSLEVRGPELVTGVVHGPVDGHYSAAYCATVAGEYTGTVKVNEYKKTRNPLGSSASPRTLPLSGRRPSEDSTCTTPSLIPQVTGDTVHAFLRHTENSPNVVEDAQSWSHMNSFEPRMKLPAFGSCHSPHPPLEPHLSAAKRTLVHVSRSESV